jgi:hypothetical protein
LLDRFPPALTTDRQQGLDAIRVHWKAIALWSALAVLVLGFLAWAIFWAPGALTRPAPTDADLNGLPPKERVTAQIAYATARNGVRTTLIGTVAGAAVLTTGYLAWRQVIVGRLGQLSADMKNCPLADMKMPTGGQ